MVDVDDVDDVANVVLNSGLAVFGTFGLKEETGCLDGVNDGALVGDDGVECTVGLAEGGGVGCCVAGLVVGAPEGPADEGGGVGCCVAGFVVGALEGPADGRNVGRPKEGTLDAGDCVSDTDGRNVGRPKEGAFDAGDCVREVVMSGHKSQDEMQDTSSMSFSGVV